LFLKNVYVSVCNMQPPPAFCAPARILARLPAFLHACPHSCTPATLASPLKSLSVYMRLTSLSMR
jgi:hypothetical protein